MPDDTHLHMLIRVTPKSLAAVGTVNIFMGCFAPLVYPTTVGVAGVGVEFNLLQEVCFQAVSVVQKHRQLIDCQQRIHQ